MNKPESELQLPLFHPDKERSERAPLFDPHRFFNNDVIVYFEGIESMIQFSRAFKESLEDLDKDWTVKIIHYQQLLFHEKEGLRGPFAHYSESPLIDWPSNKCITIVENFNSFDEDSRIRKVLDLIDKAPSSVVWVLLVPTWKTIKPSQALREWSLRNNVQRLPLPPDLFL